MLAVRSQLRDRARIGEKILPRIIRRERGFAEHIVRMGVALPLILRAALQRFVNTLAEHELLTEHAHRLFHRIAHHRIADPPHHRMQGAEQVGWLRIFRRNHLAGQHQRPGRGIHQRRRRMTEMTAPVGGDDLVLNQCIDGWRVRHPQQGFGQTHQGDALAGGESVFSEEGFHQTAVPVGANLLHQPRSVVFCLRALRRTQPNRLLQAFDRAGFIGQMRVANLVAPDAEP